MTEKKFQEKIQHKSAEIQNLMAHADYFNVYILDTLNSFAFRYFDHADEAEMVAPNLLRVSALEKGIKEAILIKNAELRAGIGELVKRVSKAEGPTIRRELRVNIIYHSPIKGEALITARISFGHPAHDFLPGTYVEKSSQLLFVDDLQFRNTLARHLEEVCELF